MTKLGLAGWTMLSLAVGCGGDATPSSSTGSGGAASGAGASGTAGSSSATGGGICPATEPVADSPCSLPDGQICSYSVDCCSDEASCVDGKWQVEVPPCDEPGCQSLPPRAGSDCSCGPTTCAWDETCANGGVAKIAGICMEQGWYLQGDPCPDMPCGEDGLTCKPNEVCLKKAGGPGFSFQCARSTCGALPVTCACAGELCGGPPYVCTGYDAGQLSCDCPTCA